MPQPFDKQTGLYPPLSPFASGRIRRGEHSIYYEQSGNPEGLPVFFIHGGPGAGCAPVHRQLFNPQKYHVILMDQRGSGRSEPFASVRDNTTQDLIGDIDHLRAELGVEKMIIFGGSWGSTLGLCYGIAHPDRCLGFVLRGIFLGSRAEIDWFLHGMGKFYPEAYRRFTSHLTDAERRDILNSYHHRLTSPSHTIAMAAARAWSSYENSCATLAAVTRDGGSAALSLALIEAHYFVSDCFIPEGHILDNLDVISHLPGYIVQGRHDVICPPHSADALHRGWGAQAELVYADDAGHSAFEPSITRLLIRSLEQLTHQIA